MSGGALAGFTAGDRFPVTTGRSSKSNFARLAQGLFSFFCSRSKGFFAEGERIRRPASGGSGEGVAHSKPGSRMSSHTLAVARQSLVWRVECTVLQRCASGGGVCVERRRHQPPASPARDRCVLGGRMLSPGLCRVSRHGGTVVAQRVASALGPGYRAGSAVWAAPVDERRKG